jgi:hypothetical protein
MGAVDDSDREGAEAGNRVAESVERALDTVRRTLRTNEILAAMPGHEETGEEGIIAAEQEIALLEVERELVDGGGAASAETRAFIEEATRTTAELSGEDRQRRQSRKPG